MAFNPFKRPVEAPVDYSSSPKEEQSGLDPNEYQIADDEATRYDSSPINQEENITYEGLKIKDLETSGLQTISLLKVASQNVIDRTKFNVPLLEATPLALVIQNLGGEKIRDNLYQWKEHEFAIKENKWFNRNLKRGNINAISLVKHLTALEENIEEKENQKTLFISACKKLTNIQDLAQKQELIVEPDVTPSKIVNSKNSNENKAEQSYEPSETVKKAQNQSNNNIDWRQLTEQLNSIPLNLVMEHIGANPNEDGHRGKWKIWRTGHNVQVTGQKWHSWNANTGGYGGISLLAFHLGIENNIDDRIEENKKYLRKLAIKELIKVFGSDYNVNDLGGDDTPNFKEPFSMPHVIDFKINTVRQYLHEKRGLPMWIINKQIKAGSIFAGYPSDWKEEPNLKNPDKLTNDKVWAVFLAVNGNAAEMRAIERTDNFAKLLAKGSDKEMGGFLIKAERNNNERTVVALEAAIDTMSYHAFYPGRIATSCMGVNFNLAVKAAVDALDNGFKFQLGFDNDLAGNEAAVRFREQLITELGEEEYLEHIKNSNIGYFDLGIKCLLKTIKQGGIYYFDVKNNDMGHQAVKMFQEQLFKVVPKDTVKDLLSKGKIRYINIAPTYGMIQDPYKEAENALSLLLSNKPYYLVLKSDDEENQEVKQKREAFEKAFFDLAKEHRSTFEKDGRLIYKKQALAKDWNEFFLVMKKDPKFQDRLQQLEDLHSNYNEEEKNMVKKSRKP